MYAYTCVRKTHAFDHCCLGLNCRLMLRDCSRAGTLFLFTCIRIPPKCAAICIVRAHVYIYIYTHTQFGSCAHIFDHR